MAGRGFSSGSRDTGLSIYVGAAPADLQPMLSADIGILVGADPEVRQLLPAFGIDLRLLTTGEQSISTHPPDRNAWVAAVGLRRLNSQGCRLAVHTYAS